MIKDTLATDAVANITSIGGILAFIMQFTPIITAAVLITALVLNILRIYDWYKNKKQK